MQEATSSVETVEIEDSPTMSNTSKQKAEISKGRDVAPKVTTLDEQETKRRHREDFDALDQMTQRMAWSAKMWRHGQFTIPLEKLDRYASLLPIAREIEMQKIERGEPTETVFTLQAVEKIVAVGDPEADVICKGAGVAAGVWVTSFSRPGDASTPSSCSDQTALLEKACGSWPPSKRVTRKSRKTGNTIDTSPRMDRDVQDMDFPPNQEALGAIHTPDKARKQRGADSSNSERSAGREISPTASMCMEEKSSEDVRKRSEVEEKDTLSQPLDNVI